MEPRRRDEPCLPLETLPSPVIDERNDEFADDIGVEMLKLSLVNWLVAMSVPRDPATGLVKSKVSVWEGGGGRGGGAGGRGEERVRVWVTDEGPRRNRAWPVRLRMEMTFLNLEMV